MDDQHPHDDATRGPEGPRARPHRHGDQGEAPAPVEPTRLADGVLELDTMLGGWSRVTAGYLLVGPRPVLVETGSQTSVPTLLAALEALGVV